MKLLAIFWVPCVVLEVISSQDQKPTRPSFYRPRKVQNQEIAHQNASDNCNEFFSYHSDDEGFFGLVTIAKPDLQRSVVRAFLSVAALLPSVRDNAPSERNVNRSHKSLLNTSLCHSSNLGDLQNSPTVPVF